MIREAAKMKGILTIQVFKNGERTHMFCGDNLIVSGGRVAMAKLLAGEGTSPDKHVATFGVGTGIVAPNMADTALTGSFTKAITSVTYPQPGVMQFNFSIELSEANGTAITEWGLFCADGTLFSRKVEAAINKTGTVRIEGTWQIIF